MQTQPHHILFILDESGSMQSSQTDVIAGFNEYILDLAADGRRNGWDSVVSLVKFHTYSSTAFWKLPVEEVPRLTTKTYRPDHSTALLDAIHEHVGRYARELEGQGDPPVLVLIFTDGAENSSRKANWKQVTDLIAELGARENWTFAYMGAHLDAWDQGQSLGVAPSAVAHGDNKNMRANFKRMSDSTRKYREDMAGANRKKSDGFFGEDSDQG